MKSPSLRIGSLPPIRISAGTVITVAVLAVVIYPALAPGGLTTAATVGLAVAIALFMILSVLVHELAHALSARAFGATVDHIALTLWGGHTQYRGESLGNLPSTVISLAGPLSNLLLAAVATAAGTVTDPGGAAAVFWTLSAWLNVALALFNLLPGLPMDGGRALEAILGAVTRDRLLGTRITAWIGRVIAVAVIIVPLVRLATAPWAATTSLLILLWAVLIAGMLWQGASRALEAARLQDRIRHLDAAELARPMRIVPPDQLLGELVGADRAAAGGLDDVLVLEGAGPRPGRDGTAAVGRGFRIDPAAAGAVPPAHRGGTAVRAVAGSLGEVGLLDVGLTGDALVAAMLGRPHPAYLVRRADGTIPGVIFSADVNALLRRS